MPIRRSRVLHIIGVDDIGISRLLKAPAVMLIYVVLKQTFLGFFGELALSGESSSCQREYHG